VGDHLGEVHDFPRQRRKGQRVGRSPGSNRRGRDTPEKKAAVVGEAVGDELGQRLVGAAGSRERGHTNPPAYPDEKYEHDRIAPLGPELSPTAQPDDAHGGLALGGSSRLRRPRSVLSVDTLHARDYGVPAARRQGC